MHLNFDEVYRKAHTKHVSFEVFAPDSDPGILEGLRELMVRRGRSVGQESRPVSLVDLKQHINHIEDYLALLRQYILKAKDEGWPLVSRTTASTGFLWSSPLSQLPPSAHFSLPTLSLEYIMALIVYAGTLQESAQQMCRALLGSTSGPQQADGSTEHVDYTAATMLFRRAAGVYSYIKDTLLPRAAVDIQLVKDPPLELQGNGEGIHLLEGIALAQAQGVAADCAEVKGFSPAAAAAVHLGAVALYETAAERARSLSSQGGKQSHTTSARLRKFLALSAELHATKALKAQAAVHREKGELGVSCACLRAGLHKVLRCVEVAGQEEIEWRAVFTAEASLVEKTLSRYDKERVMVAMQAIATTLPPASPAKIIALAAEYHPLVATERYFL